MAILFDLDGTLLDTAPDFAAAIHIMQNKANITPTALNILRPYVSEGTSSLIQIGFGIPREHPEHAALCKEFLNLYEIDICRYTQPFPGILSLLTYLETQNIPWGIVTNKYGYLTDKILTELNLKNRAACVVSGDTTPYSKPHPEPLLHACKTMNIEPSTCIYIGDAERDIQAGNAAGMTTVAALFGYINNMEHALHWGAHHHVHHAQELIPLIQHWKLSNT